MDHQYPRFVLIISGKRKCGKDYFADILQMLLGSNNCTIIRLSEPLKSMYAIKNNLNFNELMKSTSYKEMHREKMILWGENKRNECPSIFCDEAVKTAKKTNVWIISDARRKSDIKYFQSKFLHRVILVRIECDLTSRETRGFVFTKGIDDAESECGLDKGVIWDYIVDNTNNNFAKNNPQNTANSILNSLKILGVLSAT